MKWQRPGPQLNWINTSTKGNSFKFIKVKASRFMSPEASVPKHYRESTYVSYCLKTWSKCCFTLLGSINTTSRGKKVALHFHTKDPTANLCFGASRWMQQETSTECMENQHCHCCPTDEKVEAGESFIQGHEDDLHLSALSWALGCAGVLNGWKGRCVIQSQDLWICYKNKEKNKKGQN